jgi:hypothetical protein
MSTSGLPPATPSFDLKYHAYFTSSATAKKACAALHRKGWQCHFSAVDDAEEDQPSWYCCATRRFFGSEAEAETQQKLDVAEIEAILSRFRGELEGWDLTYGSDGATDRHNHSSQAPAPKGVPAVSGTRADDNLDHGHVATALQAELDSVAPGSSRQLSPKEFAGPVILNSGIDLDGNNATIWALRGPVVQVAAPGVKLKNLRIEVTGELAEMADLEACALHVEPGVAVQLEDVEVRGSVLGLTGEEGKWYYPNSLHLGWIEAQRDLTVQVRIHVPCECKLMSEISGLDVRPHGLSAGVNTVEICLEGMPRDTLLSGTLVLQTAQLKRRIGVTGHACPNDGVLRDVVADGQLLWSCPEVEPVLPPPPSSPLEPASVPLHSPSLSIPPPPTHVEDLVDDVPSAPAPASAPGHVEPVPPVSSSPAAVPDRQMPAQVTPPAQQAEASAAPQCPSAPPQPQQPVAPVEATPPPPAVPPQPTPPPATQQPVGRTTRFKRQGTDFPTESPFSTSQPSSAATDGASPVPKAVSPRLSPLFSPSSTIAGSQSEEQRTEEGASSAAQDVAPEVDAPKANTKKVAAKISSVFLKSEGEKP